MNKDIKGRTDVLRELLLDLESLQLQAWRISEHLNTLQNQIGFEVGRLIGINEDEKTN